MHTTTILKARRKSPRRQTLSTLLAVTLLTLSQAPFSQAKTIGCTEITSLPAVITTQGVYCFTDNLSTNITSGSAIEIQTNRDPDQQCDAESEQLRQILITVFTYGAASEDSYPDEKPINKDFWESERLA